MSVMDLANVYNTNCGEFFLGKLENRVIIRSG